MRHTNDNVIAMLLLVIVVLLVMNLLATRFETRVAQAGGGHQGSEGYIAFSGQKTDGPELVYVISTKKGKKRKVGDHEFDYNGPRLAVYTTDARGKIKLTSMRNIGPDLEQYADAIGRDTREEFSVRTVREIMLEGKISHEKGIDPDAPTDSSGLPDDSTGLPPPNQPPKNN